MSLLRNTFFAALALLIPMAAEAQAPASKLDAIIASGTLRVGRLPALRPARGQHRQD